MPDSSTGSNESIVPYDLDRELYEDFWNWLTRKLPDQRSDGADNAAGDIYDFLKWIRETDRPAVAGRIALPSLQTDIQAYVTGYVRGDLPGIGEARNRLLNLRDMLRDFDLERWARQRGTMFPDPDEAGPSSRPLDRLSDSSETGSAGQQGPGPYEEDQQLYKDFRNWLTEKLSGRSWGADTAAGDMHKFFEWIRETNRRPLVNRIALPSLDSDILAYAADYIGRDVLVMGGFRNRLLNLRDMLRDFHDAGSENRARGRGVTFQGFEEAGPASLSVPPTLPSDGGILAAGAPGGLVQRDFGAYVPSAWRGGSASDTLVAELRRSGLLPGALRPRSVLINGLRYAAVLWPGRVPATPNNPEGENFILTPGHGNVLPLSSARLNETRPGASASAAPYQLANLPDLASRVGIDWIHGPRVADPVLIGILAEFGLLPSREVPMPCFYIQGRPYTAESGPGGSVLMMPRVQGP